MTVVAVFYVFYRPYRGLSYGYAMYNYTTLHNKYFWILYVFCMALYTNMGFFSDMWEGTKSFFKSIPSGIRSFFGTAKDITNKVGDFMGKLKGIPIVGDFINKGLNMPIPDLGGLSVGQIGSGIGAGVNIGNQIARILPR